MSSAKINLRNKKNIMNEQEKLKKDKPRIVGSEEARIIEKPPPGEDGFTTIVKRAIEEDKEKLEKPRIIGKESNKLPKEKIREIFNETSNAFPLENADEEAIKNEIRKIEKNIENIEKISVEEDGEKDKESLQMLNILYRRLNNIKRELNQRIKKTKEEKLDKPRIIDKPKIVEGKKKKSISEKIVDRFKR